MKYFVSITFIMLSLFSSAQLPVYYTELVKGTVTVSGNNKTMPVQPRTLLYRNDIIKIGNRSEVTLVNDKAEYIVLNKKGDYKVGDLEKMNVKAHGVTEKYFHLVWEELLQPHRDLNKYDITNMGTWGGVTRGSCSYGKFPFPGMVMKDTAIVFTWDSIQNAKAYRFTLKDENKSDILRLLVRDTQISIDMSLLAPQTPQSFYWSVENDEPGCEAAPEYKFDVVTATQYRQMIDEVVGTVRESNRYELDAAEALEQKGLYEAAAEYLKKAAIE